jgi:hypothetical protein
MVNLDTVANLANSANLEILAYLVITITLATAANSVTSNQIKYFISTALNNVYTYLKW